MRRSRRPFRYYCQRPAASTRWSTMPAPRFWAGSRRRASPRHKPCLRPMSGVCCDCRRQFCRQCAVRERDASSTSVRSLGFCLALSWAFMQQASTRSRGCPKPWTIRSAGSACVSFWSSRVSPAPISTPRLRVWPSRIRPTTKAARPRSPVSAVRCRMHPTRSLSQRRSSARSTRVGVHPPSGWW